jgi:hypothetical protein
MTGSVSVPLGILNRSVPSGSHICAFYAGSAGRDEVVLPFLAEGLRTGQKCLAVLDSTSPADVLAKLGRSGVDADQAAQAGQIEVETPGNAYFRSGTFSTDDILSFWGQGITKAKDAGQYDFLRATGEMPSVLDHPDGRTEFFRFEAMLNQFSSPLPLVLLCLYDLGGMGAEVLMQALRTHPTVIVDGVIHENPYFIEPGTFLARIGDHVPFGSRPPRGP